MALENLRREERMQDHFVKSHFAYHLDKCLDILFISISV